MAPLYGADVRAETLQVHDRGGAAIGDADQKGFLERARAGALTEIIIRARTFVQRAAPNRNHLRFEPTALVGLAASFRGVPFLRDHDQRAVEARGGTVLDSWLTHEGEEATIEMTVRAVKRWAVEGALDGTIDRFSIGFIPTGPVLCSVHKSPVFEKCSCWPGDRVPDRDERVEFVFTSAEGVEVSAVNVPAVTGTGVQDVVLAALAPRPTPHTAPHFQCHHAGLPAVRDELAEWLARPAVATTLERFGLSADQARRNRKLRDMIERSERAAARRRVASSAREFAASPAVRTTLHAVGLDDKAIALSIASGSLEAFLRGRGAL